MKRVLLLSLVFFTSLASAELVWKKNVINYDAKPTDEDVTAVFYFVNQGQSPVKILDAKSSCGCTVLDLEKDKPYAPGEMGKIKAKFTFGERTGAQQKEIRVMTNDTKEPFYQLSLNVNIPLFVSVEPQLVTWASDEAHSTKVVTLTVQGNDPVDIKLPELTQDKFTVALAADETGKVYKLSITPQSTARKGKLRIDLISSVLKKDGMPRTVSVMAETY